MGMSFTSKIWTTMGVTCLAVLIAAGAASYYSQASQLEHSLGEAAQNDLRVFRSQLEADAQGLGRALGAFASAEALIDAFVARNREELLARAKPIFAEMKSAHNITHMYFFEPDGTTFLRAHKPEQFGDKNKRNSFRRAVESGKLATSLDMGKNFFSLRAVRPLHRNGQLIGYMEVAQEIDHLFKATRDVGGRDVAIWLSQDYQKAKGTEIKGESAGGFTLLDSSDKALSARLGTAIDLAAGLSEPRSAHVGEHFVHWMPFEDGAGEVAGIVAVQADVAPLRAQMWASFARSFPLLAMTLLAGFAVLGWLIMSATRLLGGDPAYAKRIVDEIAAGRLAVPIEVRAGDTASLLAAMKSMQGRLRATVTGIQESAQQLASAARQLTASAEDAAQRSAGQTESTSAMAMTVEEVSTGIARLSEDAARANEIAGEAGTLSARGGGIIQGAVAEISNISSTVHQSSAVVRQLADQSQQISRIVSVIHEIADQTNLLALNAAIEAARAGEQGRGFAVVADEVRKLAERTTSSTREISAMIDSIGASTQRALDSMDVQVSQVEQGVRLANEAGAAIRDIERGSQGVVIVVGDIASALSAQASASNEMAGRIEQIASLCDGISADMEQTAQAARSFDQLAGELRQSVAYFEV